jgi:hypothetical protein
MFAADCLVYDFSRSLGRQPRKLARQICCGAARNTGVLMQGLVLPLLQLAARCHDRTHD